MTVEDLPSKIREKEKYKVQKFFEAMPTLDELERRYLIHVLETTKHNKTQASEILGINRRTLYRMAERYGIPLKED